MTVLVAIWCEVCNDAYLGTWPEACPGCLTVNPTGAGQASGA